MISTILAEWVFPVAGPPIPDGVVIVEGSHIAEVLHITELDTARHPINLILEGYALLPGLINAHTHLDLSGAVGQTRPVPDAPFTEWLRRVIAFRRSRSESQIRQDYARGLEQSWRAGVVLLADIIAGRFPQNERAESPAIVIPFKELLGLSFDRAELAAREAEEWLNQVLVGPEFYGLSPHAPYSVRQSLLASAGQLCRRNRHPLSIHLAESPEEIELIEHRSGPMVKFLSDLGVYDPDGLVTSIPEAMELVDVGQPKLYVHGNQLNPQTPFPPHSSLIYCPRTHAAFWPNHEHPFMSFLEQRVNVALGTDSLASNPDLDILAEARFVAERHPALPGEILLRMITLNGARALDMDDFFGMLARGYPANLVAVPIPKRPCCTDPHVLLFRDTKDGERFVMIQGEWRNLPRSSSA